MFLFSWVPILLFPNVGGHVTPGCEVACVAGHPEISGSGLAFSPAISGKKGLVRGGTFWLLFLAVEEKCARALTRN